MARQVVVVGGGFAGLAAGVTLARAGVGVTLLEARPFLGGRAYSFRDPVTGDVVDNGPHAFVGAYVETLDFLAEIGASAKLAMQPRLSVAMADPDDGVGAVEAPALPGPLQAPAALLRYRLLGRGERLGVVTGALRLVARARRNDGWLAERTVAEALAAVGQSVRMRARFWDPLAIATLNETPEVAAAAPFAAVLARLFFAGASAARFAVATVPLSELYTDDARRVIEERGGVVRTGAGAKALTFFEDRVDGVVLRDGTRVEADAVVLALPVRALLAILPEPLRTAAPFGALATLATSPIVSVHLWLDRRVEWGSGFLGLTTGRAQWLFDCGGARVATVSSGARFWDDADDETIVAEVIADVRAVLPALRAATVRRALVVRERHATLSLTPAAHAARPGIQTPVSNLFLAGDWIQTGLPATIEGAVMTGRAAAREAQAVSLRPRVSSMPITRVG